jgi:dipeptidyl aminopeptidase/acylaminoacyl peptidase
MKRIVFGVFTVLCIVSCISYGAESTSYETRQLSTTRDDLRINGVVLIPKGDREKIPTIIMSHGFAVTYNSQLLFAQNLASQGIAVYLFDFCGGSMRSSSDGETTEMSVLTEQQDLNSVINMIKQQDFVDVNNIFLWGHSQGGFVSAVTAASRAEDVKGLILYAPALNIPDVACNTYASTADIPERMDFWEVKIGKVYWESVYNYNIYENIGAYTKSVLILHGDRDDIVPISFSEEALHYYKSARLITFPGAGHAFYGADMENAVKAAYDFIKTNMR